ncbi:MAG: glutamate 5-kinase [Planctomycetaceae bacterium]|jgi:glutamate 5-kinase|nr:glutamate 5-kinase [Planctomycetaceae bacterium]
MTPSLLRDEILKTSDVIVVKVGTNVLTLDNGLLNEERIAQLTNDLCRMIFRKKRIILVSSGAVGAGMGRLGLSERPTELSQLQAVAAIGQGKLIETYERFLNRHGIHSAQVLLTADDLSSRKRYLNARNAIRTILDYGALPIINENDTVSVDEFHTTFVENDRLASLVANLFETPLLILLTDVDGLFDRDPSDPEAKLIPVVASWSPDLMKLVAEKRSHRSKGGMSSKLKAAKMITGSGGNVIIANGNNSETLHRLFSAEEVGTIFLTQNSVLTARKRWLGYAVRVEGRVVLDEGAVDAVCRKGKSILPIGIVDADGTFEKGGIVSIVDCNGKEIARGLTNYGLKEVLLIRGKKTSEISTILGIAAYTEVIHRDNLKLVD